jgi:tetratricopeptide (TPR) repeat protein
MMLKDLSRLRLAIAFRQYGEYQKSLGLFDELIMQATNNPKCQAMAYTGKMITLIKMANPLGNYEELYDNYKDFVDKEPGVEDDFMRFYKIRFMKKFQIHGNIVNTEISKIIHDVVITENNDINNPKVVLNVNSDWSSDILANYWEVISICYYYLRRNIYTNYCIQKSRTYAQKVKLLSDKFTIFSEVELKDISAEKFLKELDNSEKNGYDNI